MNTRQPGRIFFWSLKATATAASALVLMCASANAAVIIPVQNWMIGQGNPVTYDMNTSSPAVGNGDPDNADAVILFSDFPAVTLANSGDSVALTGMVSLVGITSSDAGTNQQFRLGLFDRLGNTGTSGWLGYFTANSTSINAGVLRQRNAGNPDLFISNTGSTVVASTANPPNSRTGAILTDSTYGFSLEITRDGDNYDISGSLTGGPASNFNDSFTISDLIPAATETYTFNHVGFLLGTAMNVDRAIFGNIQVIYVPEPSSILLCGLAAVLLSSQRRRR
jgi:hypothetical protein